MVSVSAIAERVQNYQAVAALQCLRFHEVFFHIYPQPVYLVTNRRHFQVLMGDIISHVYGASTILERTLF